MAQALKTRATDAQILAAIQAGKPQKQIIAELRVHSQRVQAVRQGLSTDEVKTTRTCSHHHFSGTRQNDVFIENCF